MPEMKFTGARSGKVAATVEKAMEDIANGALGVSIVCQSETAARHVRSVILSLGASSKITAKVRSDA